MLAAYPRPKGHGNKIDVKMKSLPLSLDSG
jgi:hypothetical protein